MVTLAVIASGVLLMIAIARDQPRHGTSATVGFGFAWLLGAGVGMLRSVGLDVPVTHLYLALAAAWLGAVVVSIGHPADWIRLIDDYHGVGEGVSRDEFHGRLRWNLVYSPWLMVAWLTVISSIVWTAN